MQLEKHTELDLSKCTIIQQDTSEPGNTKYILERNGRYFYREETAGSVIRCCEIAVDWKPFGKYTVFAFTPDDLHVYQLEAGRERIGNFTILQIDPDLIRPGMHCTYHGNKLEYIDNNHVSFDGSPVLVENDAEFTYKALARKIKAMGGAKGLYRFLEQVAEESKHKDCPFWCTAWWQFFERYAPKKS